MTRRFTGNEDSITVSVRDRGPFNKHQDTPTVVSHIFCSETDHISRRKFTAERATVRIHVPRMSEIARSSMKPLRVMGDLKPFDIISRGKNVRPGYCTYVSLWKAFIAHVP
jgi:hypothetical protein